MRKRQKPYFLIAVLVLCGALVAFMNAPKSENPGPTPETGNKDVEVPNQSSIASDVAGKMKPATPTKPGMAMKRPGQEDGPVVLKPKVQPYKPQPNESATSTQWYTNETPKDPVNK